MCLRACSEAAIAFKHITLRTLCTLRCIAGVSAFATCCGRRTPPCNMAPLRRKMAPTRGRSAILLAACGILALSSLQVASAQFCKKAPAAQFPFVSRRNWQHLSWQGWDGEVTREYQPGAQDVLFLPCSQQ